MAQTTWLVDHVFGYKTLLSSAGTETCKHPNKQETCITRASQDLHQIHSGVSGNREYHAKWSEIATFIATEIYENINFLFSPVPGDRACQKTHGGQNAGHPLLSRFRFRFLEVSNRWFNVANWRITFFIGKSSNNNIYFYGPCSIAMLNN
jgi:hypothetical protein